MGIFDFDWMDFNGDGKVDDMELVYGLSILEDDALLERKQHEYPAWEADDEDDSGDSDDSDDCDAFFDDSDPGAEDGDCF